MTIKNISIFDLDGTIIDSSHRQATLPDGTLNLAHWFENATPEKIFEDKVLPLARKSASVPRLAISFWSARLGRCKMLILNF